MYDIRLSRRGAGTAVYGTVPSNKYWMRLGKGFKLRHNAERKAASLRQKYPKATVKVVKVP